MIGFLRGVRRALSYHCVGSNIVLVCTRNPGQDISCVGPNILRVHDKARPAAAWGCAPLDHQAESPWLVVRSVQVRVPAAEHVGFEPPGVRALLSDLRPNNFALLCQLVEVAVAAVPAKALVQVKIQQPLVELGSLLLPGLNWFQFG